MTLLDQSVGQIARQIAGATRVFHDYQLDFCCGGKHSLRDAAAARSIDAEEVAARLEALRAQPPQGAIDWAEVPATTLIAHILERFHARHREQLPEVLRLARRVEEVHGERPDCPRGLADHLALMHRDLESHMQKEEQILFPLLAYGEAAHAAGPIGVMRLEHDGHGEALQQLAALTDDLTLPRSACNTWRALYLGLRTLREDLMEHIHLENNVLFEVRNPGSRRN